jgi:hypothetical protein
MPGDPFTPGPIKTAENVRDCEGMGGKRCEEKGRFPILSQSSGQAAFDVVLLVDTEEKLERLAQEEN